MDETLRKNRASKILYISIGANALLTALKFAAGILGNSIAVLSDAVDSLSDVGTAGIALAGMRMAARKRDRGHPYGHERIESVAGLLLSIGLLFTAAVILKNGVAALIAGDTGKMPGLIGLWVSLLSVAAKELLYRLSAAGAKKLSSPALLASAWNYRTDALASVGAALGIGGARLGLWFMEPAASLLICAFILRAAAAVGKSCVDQLIDASAPEEVENAIKETVMAVPEVAGIDMLRSRKHGSYLYVDIEISVPCALSFEDAHGVAEAVHLAVENGFEGVRHCTVHANPADEAGKAAQCGEEPPEINV